MSARRAACVLLIAFGAASAQSSQELRFEAGVARLQQSGRDFNALLLGALWRESDRRHATLVSGSFTYAGDSITAAQAIAALAWRPGDRSAWHTEGGVTGAAFGVYALGRGGAVSGFVNERLVLEGGSLWTGGSAGHTLRDGSSWHATDVTAGGSLRGGGFEASAAYDYERTDDAPLMQAAGIFLTDQSIVYAFEDVKVAGHYQLGRLTVDASHAWRTGVGRTVARQRAFAWSVEYVLTPRFSLALAAGHQLADPLRGTPDGQIMSASVRLTGLPWRDGAAARAAAVTSARLTMLDRGAILVVHVVAPDSTRVEVAGSFSAWQPVTLLRTSDGWEAQVPLAPGVHRVAVRINGGPWRAPANLGKVRDEFGGEVGIVVVP
ncbi:MAG: hypothetical protein ACHQQ3_01820 [Gemmatimonadales bacterium]